MLDQLFLGVISGVVASVCFMLSLLFVKPSMDISMELCKDPENDNLYRIKVINKSRAVLNNVYYTLHYCEDFGDGIKEIQEILPRKNRMTFFDKYSGKCEDYAVRLSYEIDLNKYPLDRAELEFNIMACHSLSNTMSCKKQVYTKNSIKEGVFETGKSMRIIVHGKGKTSSPKADEATAK